MLDEWQRCKRIDNLSHVMPGWGCCRCHVYNSYDRKVCKGCGHVPCYPAALPVPAVDKQEAGWEEN